MRGRLREEFLERATVYGSRMLALSEQMERERRSRRVCDQVAGCGTSPGAHFFEAHEALSKADFIRLLGGAAKELSESRYWLGVILAREWYAPDKLAPLKDETEQLLRITKTLIARSRGVRPLQRDSCVS